MESEIKFALDKEQSKSFNAKEYRAPVNRPCISNTKKEVGIEIELEGRHWPVDRIPKWDTHAEGSLRGGGMEFVLSAPIMRDDVPAALEGLYGALKKAGTIVECSIRTSVHVHINAGGMTYNQIAAFVALWYIFEETMVNWCDHSRVGNLFCLRAVDDPTCVDQWVEVFKHGDLGWLYGEEQRYYALNPASLRKFGSFEIRSLEGCNKAERILIWTEMLLRIRDLATGRFKNPADIPSQFSGLGGEAFFLECFDGCEIVKDYENKNGIDRECWEGLRRVQPMFHCVDWHGLTEESQKEYVPNPFEKKQSIRAAAPRPRGIPVRAQRAGIDAIAEEIEARRRIEENANPAAEGMGILQELRLQEARHQIRRPARIDDVVRVVLDEWVDVAFPDAPVDDNF